MTVKASSMNAIMISNVMVNQNAALMAARKLVKNDLVVSLSLEDFVSRKMTGIY